MGVVPSRVIRTFWPVAWIISRLAPVGGVRVVALLMLALLVWLPMGSKVGAVICRRVVIVSISS